MTYKEQFPILNNYTYLNTANSGLLSLEIAGWRRKHDEKFLQGGSLFRADSLSVMETLRKNLSYFFQVKKECTFLSTNFSSGFNSILNGLDRNHRILLLKEDYPSLTYPIMSHGFETFEIQIDANLEANILESIEKFKPTIFAFSMVQYISGLRMQSDFIKLLKSDFPELLLVGDATQFLGTTAFNFEESGLDVLIGSGYKWLLGGYGNGYIFLSDAAKESIYQNRKNSNAAISPLLTGREYLSLSLEPGHLDSLNFGTLNQGINYLNTVGFENIEKKIGELTMKARIELHKRGLLLDWMVERNEHSSIISLPLEHELVNRLNQANILVSPRGAGTRISFHFYNTEDDLNHLLKVLD
ncbi:aminotransferase class V-fold PLP-dependent enzyme [Pedobacter aquatilis]|uniref:aminotransferase class V-fold PLP-dependent enzyme n=1 Tax=Pedobacter aquatilis TaxID=351343 RepID=UPI0025B47126|nr:aminotransferase class V-fold PLP-dependent enzyme [Pedobacter aquatilis]MDN3588788.1 aminotransferase class V-fold PLP-dependent enzyme [Pedobacter aquatilis]